MCGIIGTYGSDCAFNTNAKREYMRDGLYIDALRGQESTGVALLPKDKTKAPTVYKRALSGADFIQQRQTHILLNGLHDSYGMIGHNRAATKGSVIDEHAHPFQYGHITLVHNGTVNNADYLLPHNDSLKDGMKVDSAHVAWSFSRQEPDELLTKMNGAFSLVWWDARDQSLHFARNTERPMWWAISKDKRQLYYASERRMLYFLTNGLNISLHDDTFLYTAAHTHYILKTPEDVMKYETRSFKKPSGKKKSGSRKAQVGAGPTGFEKEGPPWGQNVEFSDPLGILGTGTNTSTKTSKSPTGSTSGTGDTTQTKESLQQGPSHACENEQVTASTADIIVNSKTEANKLQRTIELCEEMGIQYGKAIICIPRAWTTYKDESKIGYMACFHPASQVYVQVFGVTQARWEEYIKMSRVPLQVFSHRAAWECSSKPVFVGNVRDDIIKKHPNITQYGTPSTNDTSKTEEVQDEGDDGYKADFVEVGREHRKWVSPTTYMDMVSCGCYNCSRGITLSEANKVHWFGPHEDWPICPDCNIPQVVKEWENISNDASNTRSLH